MLCLWTRKIRSISFLMIQFYNLYTRLRALLDDFLCRFFNTFNRQPRASKYVLPSNSTLDIDSHNGRLDTVCSLPVPSNNKFNND